MDVTIVSKHGRGTDTNVERVVETEPGELEVTYSDTDELATYNSATVTDASVDTGSMDVTIVSDFGSGTDTGVVDIEMTDEGVYLLEYENGEQTEYTTATITEIQYRSQ